MTLVTECNERYEYPNMEKLQDNGFSYPTIISVIGKLEKKRCVRKIDTGGICIIRITEDWRAMVDYIKKIPNQLNFFTEPEEEEPKAPKHWWTKKDQDAVIRKYAEELGVPDEKIKEWYRSNYAKNVNAAQRLLDYCGHLEGAFLTIRNCRVEREKNRLSWSLGGDVMRNIHQFAPKNITAGGDKKWH